MDKVQLYLLGRQRGLNSAEVDKLLRQFDGDMKKAHAEISKERSQGAFNRLAGMSEREERDEE